MKVNVGWGLARGAQSTDPDVFGWILKRSSPIGSCFFLPFFFFYNKTIKKLNVLYIICDGKYQLFYQLVCRIGKINNIRNESFHT